MPETCGGDNRLLLSTPSVSTITARCALLRRATSRAVAAIASCSDVMPKGAIPEMERSTLVARLPGAEGLQFPQAAVERVDAHLVPARLEPRQQVLGGRPGLVDLVDATCMLPLASNRSAMLTAASSGRKSVIGRCRPPS